MVFGLVDFSMIPVVARSTDLTLSMPEILLAYIGPGSGLELIAQFLALVAFTATALLAILLQPIMAFFRFVRGKLTRGAAEPLASGADQPPSELGETHESDAPHSQFPQEARKEGSLPTLVSESPSEG